jgi:hypothetical protein
MTPLRYFLVFCISLLAVSFVQAIKTDYNVYPEPPLPAMGPAGSKVVDPTFGTTILRVTDANDGSFGRVLYSTYPSVNCNSTRIVGNVSSGGQAKAKFWTFDATAFSVGNGTLPSGMPNMEQSNMLWSGTNPDVLYGGGGHIVGVWYYNVATNTGGVYFDISSSFPSGYQSNQISKSLDDDVFSMSVLDAGGGKVGCVAYKRSTNTMLVNLTDGSIDETYIDKTGRYLTVNLGACNNQIYDLSTSPATLIATLSDPYNFCHNGQGSGTVFANYTGNSMGYRSLATPTNVLQILPGFFTQTTQSHHMSMNADNETWAELSRHSITGGGVSAAFDNELLQVATDGSNRVRRLAHHRSVTDYSGTYYDTPFGNISRDGRFVAFTSNWGGAAGNNRQDLYIVQIPPAPGDTTAHTAYPVYQAAGGVTVDGDLSEFANADSMVLSKASLNAVVKVLWDNNNLYLGYDVKDARLNALLDSGQTGNVWEDDAVEILIDGGSNKGTSLQADDRQYIVNIRKALYHGGDASGMLYAVNVNGTLNTNADADVGYRLEIAVPWSTLGITPAAGFKMGADFAVDDRYDETGANYQTVDWMGLSSYTVPDNWGVIELKNSGTPNEVNNRRSSDDIKVSCSPNPFNPANTVCVIMSGQGRLKLEVFSLDGRLIRTLADWEAGPGTHYFTWHGTDEQNRPVSAGIYVYRLSAGKRVFMVKTILAR